MGWFKRNKNKDAERPNDEAHEEHADFVISDEELAEQRARMERELASQRRQMDQH